MPTAGSIRLGTKALNAASIRSAGVSPAQAELRRKVQRELLPRVTMQPAAVTSVPPWSLRLKAELNAADTRARALAKGLTIPQLNWNPRPESWSVGQCLEHLCITNEIYIESMAGCFDRHPTGPVNEITPGWFARWIIRTYVEPTTPEKRARAPMKIMPTAQHLECAIVDRFLAGNARIRDLIARAEAYDVNRVRFKYPFVPLVRFTVGSALQIIVRHNHRHLMQAERVKGLSGFPRSAA